MFEYTLLCDIWNGFIFCFSFRWKRFPHGWNVCKRFFLSLIVIVVAGISRGGGCAGRSEYDVTNRTWNLTTNIPKHLNTIEQYWFWTQELSWAEQSSVEVRACLKSFTRGNQKHIPTIWLNLINNKLNSPTKSLSDNNYAHRQTHLHTHIKWNLNSTEWNGVVIGLRLGVDCVAVCLVYFLIS